MGQEKWQMLIMVMLGKGKGTIALYRRKEEIKRVPEDEGVNALIQLIKDDGKWIDP